MLTSMRRDCTALQGLNYKGNNSSGLTKISLGLKPHNQPLTVFLSIGGIFLYENVV